MGEPLYRVRASGRNGSGYGFPPLPGQPFKTVKNSVGQPIDVLVDDEGKPIIVAGITTVNKSSNCDGLHQWVADTVAAYAVTNVDALLNRSPEQGFGFARFFWKRSPDPAKDDLRNAHNGVLNDLAQLGTFIHDYIEIDLLQSDFLPEPTSSTHAQLIDAWEQFKFEHTIEPVMVEETVYNREYAYAGTMDGLWRIDGKLTLLDIKSSRNVGTSHKMQLAALRAAPEWYTKTSDGEWTLNSWQDGIEQYGFLQVRPDDDDKPRFAQFHEVSEPELDLYWQRFQGCLAINQADFDLKQFNKS